MLTVNGMPLLKKVILPPLAPKSNYVIHHQEPTIWEHNRLNLIDVVLSHVHSHSQAPVFTIGFKPAYVFQIFQSTVRTYNMSTHYGFLNFKNNETLLFHRSGVLWNLFPHSSIENGQTVKHTIKYDWKNRNSIGRTQTLDIIADNIFPVSSAV